MYLFDTPWADLASERTLLATANILLTMLLFASFWRYRRLKHRISEDAENQHDLIENLSEGIYRSSPDGRQLSANKALVKLNGYNSEREMLSSVRDIATEWYVDPHRRDEFRKLLMRDGVVTDFVSEIYRHKTRERVWITESARLVRDRKTGKPLFYEGSVREITETVKKLQAEQLLQKLSNQVPGGLFQFARHKGGKMTISFLSAGFRKLTAYPGAEGEFASMFFVDVAHPSDRQEFIRTFRESGENMQPWDFEFRTSYGGTTERWLRLTAMPEATEDAIVWHGYIADVSIRKRNEMEIEKLAYYDSLTGLPNRRMFLDRVAKAVAQSTQRKRPGALIFIDLDNFKTLNDTRGHDIGDGYLVEVAQRLRSCVRQRDMVARIGGDEFVIILEQIGREHEHATQHALRTARKALAALREDFEIGPFQHRSSASLGVVVFDETACGPDEVVKHADLAMYHVKASGRNGIALYDHQTMSAESDRYRLLADLKSALQDRKIELYFQPQIDDTGRMVGAEALCRWQHPELGLLLPERFVPLTEQFGLVRELSDHVLETGVATLARWMLSEATAGLRLAVNISGGSLAHEDFVSTLAALLARHAVDPRKLTLEVTESLLMRDRKMIGRRMHDLKELGVRLSLDDFGSGYSSLAHLKRLPFDELKIDGSFVSDIERGESDRALVKSILGTARTLKLTAVAEHVQTRNQESFLRAFGCDYFQGWLYSPALDGEAFIGFAERRYVEQEVARAAELRKKA